jgi:hypothetical protein
VGFIRGVRAHATMPQCEIFRAEETRKIGSIYVHDVCCGTWVVIRMCWTIGWDGIGLEHCLLGSWYMYVPIDEDRLELVEMLGILETARSNRYMWSSAL